MAAVITLCSPRCSTPAHGSKRSWTSDRPISSSPKPLQLRLVGKGRKERICPLWPQTAALLRSLLPEWGMDPRSTEPLFRNHRREPLTRFGVRYLLAKYCDRARASTPTLAAKRLHPHSMRHSTAVDLLKAGVDLTTMSHWLGHTSVKYDKSLCHSRSGDETGGDRQGEARRRRH